MHTDRYEKRFWIFVGRIKPIVIVVVSCHAVPKKISISGKLFLLCVIAMNQWTNLKKESNKVVRKAIADIDVNFLRFLLVT